MFANSLKISVLMLFWMTLLLGAVYPALTTGIIQTAFPEQAQGSLVLDRGGKIIGSRLIGQNFTEDRYFWGRLSAAGYNAAASTGSNLGVNNENLLAAVNARVEALQKSDPDNKASIPVDLVTASASGLDPHIGPASAEYQVSRVAKARGLQADEVRRIVAEYTESRTLGMLGEPVVNVLNLNLALDGLNAANRAK